MKKMTGMISLHSSRKKGRHTLSLDFSMGLKRSARWLSQATALLTALALMIGLTVAPSASASGVLTWTSRTTPVPSGSWDSVAYGSDGSGNGIFVAVSQIGTVMTSPDGITWTRATAGASSVWSSVTYGNGLFVAVAYNASDPNSAANRVMTSPDGVNWTARNGGAANIWRSVTYGGGMFVAVAQNQTNGSTVGSCTWTDFRCVMTSADGFNWTLQTAPFHSIFTSVTFGTDASGNGRYVAVSNFVDPVSGKSVMTSSDGVTWTAVNLPTAGGACPPTCGDGDNLNWESVTYGNGTFVAVASNYLDTLSGYFSYQVASSTDGINWTMRQTATSPTPIQPWSSVTYGSGLFVAVSSDGTSTTNQVMTSPNGINWTYGDAAASRQWKSVVFGGGKFVAVANNSVNDPSNPSSLVMTSAFITNPTITTVSPSSGSTAGGTSITITGTGFAAGATVSVGGNACTSVVVVSATSITCTTPAGSAGAKDVVVTNSDTGAATSTGGFTYVTPIGVVSITSISPKNGSIKGGTEVTITGAGFSSAATIKVGGVTAVIIKRTGSTKITIRTPKHAKGVVLIVVTNPDTGFASFNGFTYTADDESKRDR